MRWKYRCRAQNPASLEQKDTKLADKNRELEEQYGKLETQPLKLVPFYTKLEANSPPPHRLDSGDCHGFALPLLV